MWIKSQMEESMKTKTSIFFLACVLVAFTDANAYNCFGATIPDSMDKFEHYPSLKTWLDASPDTAHFPLAIAGCADKYGPGCNVRYLHASWVFSQIHETAEMPMKERLAAYGEYQKKWAQDLNAKYVLHRVIDLNPLVTEPLRPDSANEYNLGRLWIRRDTLAMLAKECYIGPFLPQQELVGISGSAPGRKTTKGEKRYRADGRDIPVLRKAPGGTNPVR